MGEWLIGFVALLVGGLALLFVQTWIKRFVESAVRSEYEHKLEEFKARLAHNNALEVEKLKSQLNIAATERQLRFSRLQEKRAEVIAELYKLVKALHFAIHDYVSPHQDIGGQTKEQRSAVIATSNAAYKFYHDNAIFLPSAVAGKIEEFIRDYRRNFVRFRSRVDNEGADEVEKLKAWPEISDAVDKLSATVLPELEQELRKLLGDEADVALRGAHG